MVASLGKFGGSAIAARITGLSWRDGSALGVLMNTRGLMELIVLNIGYEMKIISPVLFAMMVLMALVTTFATTPILHLITGGEDEIPETPAQAAFEPDANRAAILVPVANPRSAARLVGLALSATPPGTPPPRVLALVRRPAGGVRTGLHAEEHAAPRSAALGAALKLAWGKAAVITPQAAWSDNPAADLVKIAMEAHVGWILLGPHRAVFGEDFRGGVVQAVLDRARTLPLNVAVLMQDEEASFDELFAVADATPDGCAALQLAIRLAQHHGADLHVIRLAGAAEPNEREFSLLLSEAAQRIGRRLHTEPMSQATPGRVPERTASSLVLIAANLAEELGVAQRGFADGRPLVLVQGAQFAHARSSTMVSIARTASS